MEEHVKETHKASKLPQYHCKQDGCTKWFGTQIESFRHLRSEHRDLFKYRCKKCKNSFSTVQELFRHHKLHDKNHLPFEAKWSCSRCGEIFDNLNQLMEHMRIHTENTYECDECNWRFTLISELTIPDVSSMTPENTPATGARDTFKHPNYCCNTEIENITLSVVCVMMLSLQKTNSQPTR